MVASDGATAPDDISGDLTLWSFPEGRLIKTLSGRPTAISNDRKYYATFHGVREIETGKPLISLGDEVYAVHAFSPDSHYVAESPTGIELHNSAIRVVEAATGEQVSAFGKHHAFSIAISPDGVTLASGHWDVVTLQNMFTGAARGTAGTRPVCRGVILQPRWQITRGRYRYWGAPDSDVGTQTKTQSLEIGGGDVSNPAFSPTVHYSPWEFMALEPCGCIPAR